MLGCDCAVCQSSDKRDKRLRTSILLEMADQIWVVDTGPDFRYQMLRLGVKQLDAVLFTHHHKDHTGGLDDVRPYNFFQQRPMHLFANEETQVILKQQYAYAFTEQKYPGAPVLVLNTIDNQPFEVNGIGVIPIEVMHGNSLVIGFRMGDFTYITDASYIAPEEKAKIKGSKVLILNALRKKEHWSHFNLDQAVALIQELEVPKAYLTHLSHQMGLHSEVSKELPPHIEIAYDGLKIVF